ncbi:Hypothetical protein R9X50_00769600 [Acrodontium crateriforme]|uniref:Acetyl-coenzyme A synthetase n=1 Tax=Acrodontium crateriforme TaxID=150365 RepID=A0AAQ3RCW1_9PEZI|nr:Hypothetical protein R9X50_00769600 [Acrodontium crateriforme]
MSEIEGIQQPSQGIPESTSAETYQVPTGFLANHPARPHIQSVHEYKELYQESITNPNQFWARQAREHLTWERDFQTVHTGSLLHGDNAWFTEGRLNASYNCVDRHAAKNPDKPAIIYEADERDGGEGRTITYGELLREVSKLSWVLKSMGVNKGDTVAIYMPMIPEALIAFLACVRIGAVHSVVFAGFSAGALRDRIIDAKSKVVITSDEGTRGGKIIHTKKIVDAALEGCPDVRSLVFQRTYADVPWTYGRDLWWHEEAEKWPAYYAPESMSSEDPMFLLYTSGSTGKPKGLMHTTAGYLLGAAMSGKYTFDIHEKDVFFCGGDVGWITGHTYLVYAPLLLGIATVVYEGTPSYPNFSRYWEICQKHNVTHFYVAPTALRLLKRAGDDWVKPMDSLRVLGSIGEPIAPEVWKWYHDIVGQKKAHIVDTYFQTETGAHALTPLAGVTPTKPGSACVPFFGIEPALIDPVSGNEIHGNDVEGVLVFKQTWPAAARTVWGSHKRFMDVYLNVYPGYYFTGDGAARDSEGYYWVRGRVDDVVNVSGHRLSTAEIEAALLEHPNVAEAAAVGINDEMSGQAVNAFVAIKNKDANDITDDLKKEFILQVRKSIGPFAAPKAIWIVSDLPKTRSGKIMRRILRKILANEIDQIGDTTTLVDPSVVDKIIATVGVTKIEC